MNEYAKNKFDWIKITLCGSDKAIANVLNCFLSTDYWIICPGKVYYFDEINLEDGSNYTLVSWWDNAF